jgi:hypothetical protein
MASNWFMIMVSWDWNADQDAISKFQWVYNYLNAYNVPEKWEKIKADPNDHRNAIDFESLKAINLIGQRKFVIIGRTASNKVLQEISANITLHTAIKVDVSPATYVHEFTKIHIDRFGDIKKEEIRDV